MARIAAGSVVAFFFMLCGVCSAGTENCFTQADNKHLIYRVFQISRPPESIPRRRGDADPSDPYYPGTDYATTTVREKVKPSDYNIYHLLWANHCSNIKNLTPSQNACRDLRRTKGNGYDRIRGGPIETQVRESFSTYAKANDCTLIQARRLMGEGEETLTEAAKRSGLELFSDDPDRDRMNALAKDVTFGNGETGRTLVDLCVLPVPTDTRVLTGVMLDYEVYDGRTPKEALQFLSTLRDLLHRHEMQLFVTTNPLPRDPSGLTAANAHEVLALLDGFSPGISTGATKGHEDINLAPHPRRVSPIENYEEQMNVLTRNGTAPLDPALKRKLIWTVGLYDVSLQEAAQLQALFRKEGFGGIMIFRNFVKPGGACSLPANQLTACLTEGICTGNFSE